MLGQNRRDLIAERFSAAGGHDHQGVAPSQHVLQGVFLARLDPNGNFLWATNLSGGSPTPSGIAVETRVIGDACAFFHSAHGCALQKGAIEAGLHEWRFKPRFCVMFPLVVTKGTLTIDDDMKSLWCMKEKNRTHPIAESVQKEVQYLFGQEVAKTLTRSPQAR